TPPHSRGPDATPFAAGTPPVPNIYAGIAGVSIVEEAGVAAIEEHVAGLAARLIEGLTELDATVATPSDPARRGPLVCVRSADVATLVEALAEDRIVASSRDDRLRLALHLYNTDEDVDTVLAALRSRRHLL